MSGRGKGGKGLGNAREEKTTHFRRQQRQAKYAQKAEEDEYESEWHGVDLISERVVCTRYAALPPDLLISSFAWLDSRDLLSLRAVCHSWGAASRSDRAWSSSHWQVSNHQPYHAFLSSLASPSHLPFLRSLTLPIDTYATAEVKAQMYAGIKSLTKLERIAWRHWVIPPAMLSALPSLRHCEVQEVDCDGQGNDDFSAEEIAQLCKVAHLKSFRGQTLPLAERIAEALSQAPCAAGLISLRLPGTCLRPFTRDLFPPLSSLEELEVELWSGGDWESDGPPQDLSHLSSLRSLRVLSFGSVDRAMLESLATRMPAQDWSAGIESLSFGESIDAGRQSDGGAAARCIRAIAQSCSRLRVLHCAWHIDTQAATQQRWEEWIASAYESAVDDAVQRSPLSLMHLLNTPRAFRLNLLSLRFRSSEGDVSASALAQLRRRFPSLLHASFTETRCKHRTSVWDNTAADYVESDVDETEDEGEQRRGQQEDDDEDGEGGHSASASSACDAWLRFEDEHGGVEASAQAAAAAPSAWWSPAAPSASAAAAAAASALLQFSRAGGAVACDGYAATAAAAAAASASASATADADASDESDPFASIPAAMSVFPAARLTTALRRMLRSSPFHYLRALKQMARIPLSEGERHPAMRVAPRIPPIAVDMCV